MIDVFEDCLFQLLKRILPRGICGYNLPLNRLQISHQGIQAQIVTIVPSGGAKSSVPSARTLPAGSIEKNKFY